ncbi:MAG: DUF4912 domain-containing protein [Acidobacteria bacterium]|nr:DUF4912 domain-containing protein [Acidobacteriota bacterium]
MSDTKEIKAAATEETADDAVIEFVLDEPQPVSSGESVRPDVADVLLRAEASAEITEPDAENDEETAEAEPERSPAFKLLSMPTLPELERENRARLQMQSPNRLHFYWSVRSNPYQTLNKALGANTGSYTLALKLVDLKREAEEIHAADAEGSWWFNVNADSDYRAEIGFYAPNRPFIRVLYSNTVKTPRKSPSPRVATETDWRIPAQKFAQVLDVSGFKQDAFDVAIAGDDVEHAENASYSAFARLTGHGAEDVSGFDAEEVRYAMTLLAAGAALDELRHRIGEKLFAMLQAAADNISRDNALAALKSEFEIEENEFEEEFEEFGPAVFGASLVNFPKRLRTRPRGLDRFSKLEPLASHSIGRVV